MAVELSAQQPWPGLASYDEDAQAYFHGREDESEALAQQIIASPLTVLYGRSGLGKSSLLKAGVFPRLRAQCWLPVYLRLDFSDHAQVDPVAQIGHRLDQAITRAGLDAPPRGEHETLWHWLHRKDFELWSKDNRLWRPVLVFDQFEELFSRSGGNLQRISKVFDTLADLAENRIEADVADRRDGRDKLDLITQRYRMLLSFREDFLPDVRAWERQVPSLLRHDLRLVPMTREQAVGAVRRVGASVLAPGAAERLVDFVGALAASGQGNEQTGNSTLSGRREALTIEPALLSLCGSQLAMRVQPGQKIDGALLSEAGFDILEGFYRDAVQDMPEHVQVFIENHLLQGDRTRGSYARDEALEQGFISSAQLAVLTDDRRLLRVAQEGGVPRIELIHDRLVDVVRRARDRRAALRHAEAAREADQRQAAERLAVEQSKLLEVQTAARKKAEHDRGRLARSRKRVIAALAVAMLLLAAALWQTYQVEQERDQKLAEEQQKDGYLMAMRAAAVGHVRIGEALDRTTRIWIATQGADGRADGLEQVLAANAALPSVPRPADQVEVLSHQLFDQASGQAAFVVDSLNELGFAVGQAAAQVPGRASVLLAGAGVPLADLRGVALSLIRASVPVTAVHRWHDGMARAYPAQVRPGAQSISIVPAPTPTPGEPPALTVEQLMADDFSR